ncbi:MAG: methionine--tRNA ligase subunit beta [Candidatus Micrarchaeota archaeon]|nr:methionine--tRNA ligase subunit beta [Candidatus Micrarchaeota archaeon]
MDQNIEKINFETFLRVEMKTATIISAERVEGSEKLIKLKVDLGYEQRQLVAGIAQYYKPEDLIGKQIIVVANLEPRKIKGIESNGMLLAVEEKNGKIVLLTTEKPTENGLRVH